MTQGFLLVGTEKSSHHRNEYRESSNPFPFSFPLALEPLRNPVISIWGAALMGALLQIISFEFHNLSSGIPRGLGIPQKQVSACLSRTSLPTTSPYVRVLVLKRRQLGPHR